ALDVPYAPPELPRVAAEYAAAATKPTLLLYKRFGAVSGEPELAPNALLAAVEEMYRVVYGIVDPLHDERYLRLAAALDGRTRVPIRERTVR
ncbi:MAG TPA: hypothetical protein VN224_00170, partial [Xanthomonadales bacterium]|nr:hypothetical protein [Xanthomonadales bacterium]